MKPLKTRCSPARWSATLASPCHLPRWGRGTAFSWRPTRDTLSHLHWHFSHPAECGVVPGCCFGLQGVAGLDVFPGLAAGSMSQGGRHLLLLPAGGPEPRGGEDRPGEERMAPWRRGWSCRGEDGPGEERMALLQGGLPAGLELGRAVLAHLLLVVPSSQRCWAHSLALWELVQSKLPDPCEVCAAPSSLLSPLRQPPVLPLRDVLPALLEQRGQLARAFVCGAVLSWAKLNRFTKLLTFFFFLHKAVKDEQTAVGL